MNSEGLHGNIWVKFHPKAVLFITHHRYSMLLSVKLLTIIQFIWSLCGLVKKIGNLTDKNINGNNLSVCLTLRKCLSKLYAYLTII